MKHTIKLDVLRSIVIEPKTHSVSISIGLGMGVVAGSMLLDHPTIDALIYALEVARAEVAA